MEHGNRVWRYPIPPGADDDPARARFVEQAQARISEQSLQARRQAARKATETLREKLRAAGIDPHTYYSMLAQRGNAARWRKQDAAPPVSEAAARVTECAPAPPQASQAAARITQAEAVPAEAVAEAGQAQAQATEAAEAAESTPRRMGTLPVHLL